MKDLPAFPTELDIYLNSLLDQLRTKYYNVSVYRGRDNSYFYYYQRLTDRGYKSITIPNTELLAYFESKQTPPQIKELLK